MISAGHAFAPVGMVDFIPRTRLVFGANAVERVGELAGWREQEVVVYCHHGMRSAHAIGWLRHQGFTHLHNLTGGIDRWSVEVDANSPRY